MSSEDTFFAKDTNFIQLNDVPDKAIVICDQDGTIINANANFCALIGCTLNQLVGNYIAPALFLNIGFRKDSFTFKELLSGKQRTGELHFITATNTHIFIEVKAKVVAGKNIAIFFKDISEQRNLNLALQRLTTDLENLNKEKSRFIAVLAHDLKSPFNSILGFTALMKENFREFSIDETEKYINYIETASKNTYNLLVDTLDWIRSENGYLKVVKDTHELNSIILAVLENFKLNATEKAITIHFKQERKIWAFCDANIIKIVLRNLLSNAIKYTNKKGEIHIRIARNDDETKISIQDNGIGISKELQSQLFCLNEVKSSEGTAHEKGTGMGLLLCKEFINKHNGNLYVTSEKGVGSTFTFTIPNHIIET